MNRVNWSEFLFRLLGTILLFYCFTYLTDFIFGGNRPQSRGITVAVVIGIGYALYDLFKKKSENIK